MLRRAARALLSAQRLSAAAPACCSCRGNAFSGLARATENAVSPLQLAVTQQSLRGFACRTKFDAPLPKMARPSLRGVACCRCRGSSSAPLPRSPLTRVLSTGVRRVRPDARGQRHRACGRPRGTCWPALTCPASEPLCSAVGVQRRAGGGRGLLQARQPLLTHAPSAESLRREGAFEVTTETGLLLFSKLKARRRCLS